MADRALRGTRLGATSYENAKFADMAPRIPVPFTCPDGHVTTVTFAEDADLPSVWECRTCGGYAKRRGGPVPEQRAAKPVRTHWDMLLERRSVDALEDLLAERLDLLRASGGARAAHEDRTYVAGSSRRKKTA